MRKQLHNPGLGLIRYGIRDIIDLVHQLSALNNGFVFYGENIGDPVAKGWSIPGFVKVILNDLIYSDNGDVFGYAHSKGHVKAREWVAQYARRVAPGSCLTSEEVIFCNGLGAGISAFYRMIASGSRVLQPMPGYPAHLSAERFVAGAESICYRLDPNNGWQPDLDHLESQIKAHPEVIGILLINPNNPTGSVYTTDTLESMIRLAERYGLMLISDEIYFRLIFNGAKYEHISGLAHGRVPLVVMRGVSKDIPWPGARCGWLEFHNLDMDEDFRRFFEGIKKLLMVEVSATHLPQAAIPLIYEHPEYLNWLGQFNSKMEENSNLIADILGRTPGLKVNRIQGAFYMTVLFDKGILNGKQSLPLADSEARRIIDGMTAVQGLPLDKRFAYYLLASTGICVVPASDFEYDRSGFRVTTLERDNDRLHRCYRTVSESITTYLASA